MTNVFRNGASLFRILENSPADHLKWFLLQSDDNFRPVREAVETAISTAPDEDSMRKLLVTSLNNLPAESVEPVEVECQRVLDLVDTKGPTSLQMIIDRRLHHEACVEFEEQRGDLAKSLWAHVLWRREFDDAVSFKAIRSWRTAGRLFAAFNVDLDGKGERFSAEDIDVGKLAAVIGKKIGTSQPLSISLVDLPSVPEYPSSLLVIVRFPGQQTSVATHGSRGERRLLYYLPQDEAILIYTPADERIDVAAKTAAVRNAVANCFASESLGHDLSSRPLTSAVYHTHRFLSSMDLSLPKLTGFTLTSAKVVELELRIENWKTRLSLKAGGKTEMTTLFTKYLEQGKVLRRALGVSRVMIAIGYQQSGDAEEKFLEILISDSNNCSLNSERQPTIRNFGRKLLEGWEILRAFRDLSATEAVDLMPIISELWDLDQATQSGSYFTARGINTKRLEEALLIKRKEIEPLIEEVEDLTVDSPTLADRTIFSIDLDWMEERLILALKGTIEGPARSEFASGLLYLGTTRIGEQEVPCYLARGLDDMKTFISVDERLRARSGAGPGIVFTGRSSGPKLVGANVVVPLVLTAEGLRTAATDRSAIMHAFRAGRNLALGAGTLELVGDLESARLHVPGCGPLDLFGAHSVRAG